MQVTVSYGPQNDPSSDTRLDQMFIISRKRSVVHLFLSTFVLLVPVQVHASLTGVDETVRIRRILVPFSLSLKYKYCRRGIYLLVPLFCLAPVCVACTYMFKCMLV